MVRYDKTNNCFDVFDGRPPSMDNFNANKMYLEAFYINLQITKFYKKGKIITLENLIY